MGSEERKVRQGSPGNKWKPIQITPDRSRPKPVQVSISQAALMTALVQHYQETLVLAQVTEHPVNTARRVIRTGTDKGVVP